MGTNFYIDNGSGHLEKLIKTNKMSSVWVKDIPGIVHIGKNSSGWTFLFRAYEGKIESYADWTEYILSIGWVLDEYDNILSAQEFFKLVKDSYSPQYNSFTNEFRIPIDPFKHSYKENPDLYKDEKGYVFDKSEFS